MFDVTRRNSPKLPHKKDAENGFFATMKCDIVVTPLTVWSVFNFVSLNSRLKSIGN